MYIANKTNYPTLVEMYTTHKECTLNYDILKAPLIEVSSVSNVSYFQRRHLNKIYLNFDKISR